MKKILAIILFIWVIFYFYQLWVKNSKIEQAKENIINTNTQSNKNTKQEENKIVNNSKDNSKEKIYKIEYIDNNWLIKLDENLLSEQLKNITDHFTIRWEVLSPSVEKIIVSFSNKDSDFANDIYTLKTFHKWDKKFRYEANSTIFQNLDYWENVYLIKAISNNKEDKIKLIVNITKNKQENNNIKTKKSNTIDYEKILIWTDENKQYIPFPSSEEFGTPIYSSWEITYSNIENFKIIEKTLDKSLLNSENIWKKDWSSYVPKNAYWHIFRNIDYNNKENWVSFYILRKDNDKLIYEKHYLDFNHNLVWILKLKEYEFSSYDDMANLNQELKNQVLNWNFDDKIKITDKLFKDIIR